MNLGRGLHEGMNQAKHVAQDCPAVFQKAKETNWELPKVSHLTFSYTNDDGEKNLSSKPGILAKTDRVAGWHTRRCDVCRDTNKLRFPLQMGISFLPASCSPTFHSAGFKLILALTYFPARVPFLLPSQKIKAIFAGEHIPGLWKWSPLSGEIAVRGITSYRRRQMEGFALYLGMLARSELPFAVVALQAEGMIVLAQRTPPLSC